VVIFGLIDLLKRQASASFDDKLHFHAVLLRLAQGGCVDKEVIKGIIDLGFNYATHYGDASCICLVLSSILIPRLGLFEDENLILTQPKDKFYAIAIDAGLFEMCLNLVVKFGNQNDGEGKSFVPDQGCFTLPLRNIMMSANHVSFQEKSSKTIASKHADIVDALKSHRESIPQNDICIEIVTCMEAIVNMSHSAQHGASKLKAVCIGCSRLLTQKNIQRCSKCNSPYCSRECQVNDWRNGKHNEECKVLSNKGSQSGRGGISSKSKKQELAVQKNINTIGSDMFRKNKMRFIMQAAVKGLDIIDSVCVIDFRCSPASLKLTTFEDFLSKNFNGDGDSDFILNSREAHRGELPLAFMVHRPNEPLGKSTVNMTYCGHPENNSWSGFQKEMMEMVAKHSNMDDFWDMIYDDPELQKSLLKRIDEAEDGNMGILTYLIPFAKDAGKICLKYS